MSSPEGPDPGPPAPGGETFLYNGFISYSHGADRAAAERLQAALQRLGKPWFKRRALYILRDQTDLVADQHLWLQIIESLQKSEYLILIASPAAAQSKGVLQELTWWLENRETRGLLIAVTTGTIQWQETDFDWSVTDVLPPVLRARFSEEPLWIDLRQSVQEGRLTLDDGPFQQAVATLAATLHHVRVRDLIGRELLEQRRTMRYVWSGVGVLLLLLLALSVFAVITKHQAEVSDLRVKAATVESLIESDPVRALLLAALAAERNGTSLWTRWTMLPAVQSSLVAAVQRGRERAMAAQAQGGSPVHAVAFHPRDAHTLVSGGGDGTVRLWRLDPSGLHKVFHRSATGGGGAVRTVAFRHDGRGFATAGDDGRIRLWSLSGEQIAGWQVPLAPGGEGGFSGAACDRDQNVELATVPVCSVAFGAKDDWLVAGDAQGRIHRWNLDGTALGPPYASHGGFVSSVVVGVESPLGGEKIEVIATAGDEPSDDGADTVIRIWSLDGHLLRELDDGSYGWVADLAGKDSLSYSTLFAAARAMKLYPLDGHTILRWPLDGDAAPALDSHVEGARAVAFGSDETLAGGWEDGTIQIWLHQLYKTSPPLGGPLTGHGTGTSILTLAFSPDGRLLASGGQDGTLRIWDAWPTPRFSAPFDGRTSVSDFAEIEGGGTHVLSWALDEDKPEESRVWRFGDDPDHAFRFPGSPQKIAFSSSGDRAVTVDGAAREKFALTVWALGETSSPKELKTFEAGQVMSIAFSHDASQIAWLEKRSNGLWLQVRSAEGSSLAHSIRYQGPAPDGMAISRDGARLAVLAKGRLRVWELQSGTMTLDSTAIDPEIWKAELLPAANRLVTVGNEAVRIWKLSGDFTQPPEAMGEPIPFSDEPVISAAGGFVLIASPRGSIETWSLDGTLIHSFPHEGGVTALAATQDRRLVVTGFSADVPQGGGNSVLRLWDATGNLLARIDWIGHIVEDVGVTADGRWIFARSISYLGRWPGAWSAWLALACDRLKGHPALRQPDFFSPEEDREMALEVQQACSSAADSVTARSHMILNQEGFETRAKKIK